MNENSGHQEDPIVAEVRAIRDSYARQFDYDPYRIVEDLRAKRQKWEAMGIQFVDLPQQSRQTTSLSDTNGTREVLVIKKAQYLEDFKVLLVFSNGVTKVANLQDYLQTAKQGSVFEPLKDVEYFKTLYYNQDTETIEWSNGADFAPEFLYELGKEVEEKEEKRP